MKKKTMVALFGGLLCGGALGLMAPNGDRSRLAQLQPFEEVPIAHRGLFDNESDHPENSSKAFSLAMQHGFGIELDVRLTKDGVPVVFHDDNLFRICGVRKKAEDCTDEELREYRLFSSEEAIPRLADVLRQINGAVPLVIEIKAEYEVDRICEAVMALLSSYPGVYCIESFSPFVLKWFREKEPQILRGQLSMDFMNPKNETGKPWLVKFAAKNLMGNVFSRPDFISYEFSDAENFAMTVNRKAFAGKSAAWTIRSEDELCYAKKYFDMIIFEGFIPEKTGVYR